ncbi:Transposon Ty3-I Gag-Pol polyprotein [Vitis vinifera]|uniref:Transposon Ty3-I Gag-Pol polyprotein n=1 Tax=Vitis vinifera TaxID=29760 RepID=A0A438DE51_VITVI|nr:Transposon Ty3-I Gag-Pol polyprotein [Vitis vinifera]
MSMSVQTTTVEPSTFSYYSVQMLFVLISNVDEGGTTTTPAATRPLEGTSSQEEVRREDDEILRQLQSTQARISIWSLLTSSSTHRDALIQVLSQIRVKTTTTPERLIHMVMVGRATCIVFSDDDLPPKGSDHTRPLYISVGCSGHRVPFVLLENGSTLNVCHLATAIALGYTPFDFDPSKQTIQAYDNTQRKIMDTLEIEPLIGPATFVTMFQVLRIPTSFNLLLGRPWIHRAGAIHSSIHQKVKFIHDGQHGSTVVLDMMRSVSYLPSMGLGRRQHRPSEFMTIPDHDVPFGLGFIPIEVDYSYMARLHKERVRARLTHTPFDYPVRSYTISLTDYFVRASEPRTRSDVIIGGLNTTQEAELQRLIHQLHLSDGAPETSTSVLTALFFQDCMSLMTLYFLDEIDEHGTFVEVGDIMDGTIQHDEYVDEMFAMSLSQIDEIVQPWLSSLFDLFRVFIIETAEEIPIAPAPEFVEDILDVDVLFDGSVGLVEGAIYECLSVSHDITLSAPSSLTSQIFDIDDEIAQLDLDDDSSSASDSDPIDQRVSLATGDVEIVDFGTTDQPRELRIGLDLSIDEKDGLARLLRSYLDVFAWSYEDMSGLDPSIVQHYLPFLPHVRSYPEWLANVVHFPKKDGKVRVCVDFRDLNKASPKDDFLLPHINMLVDSTTIHSMLSFMDGFFGYNPILMTPKDMEKTSFITEWGTYCYRVIPFELKNVGATYQRAATTLFHDMMHVDVEVYVDDMIVKSWDRLNHLAALERFFERIRQFRLRLNPKKCTFGVTSGKLLGYMVSERGIEVDPDKIIVILDMSAPRTERECQRAFERIRDYLLSPPFLVPPTPGHPLFLYLSVLDVALGYMLAQLDDSGKK